MMCGVKGQMSPWIGVELAPGPVDFLMTASSGVRVLSMTMTVNCLKTTFNLPWGQIVAFLSVPLYILPKAIYSWRGGIAISRLQMETIGG